MQTIWLNIAFEFPLAHLLSSFVYFTVNLTSATDAQYLNISEMNGYFQWEKRSNVHLITKSYLLIKWFFILFDCTINSLNIWNSTRKQVFWLWIWQYIQWIVFVFEIISYLAGSNRTKTDFWQCNHLCRGIWFSNMQFIPLGFCVITYSAKCIMYAITSNQLQNYSWIHYMFAAYAKIFHCIHLEHVNLN